MTTPDMHPHPSRAGKTATAMMMTAMTIARAGARIPRQAPPAPPSLRAWAPA